MKWRRKRKMQLFYFILFYFLSSHNRTSYSLSSNFLEICSLSALNFFSIVSSSCSERCPVSMPSWLLLIFSRFLDDFQTDS